MRVHLIDHDQIHVERGNLFFCLCPDCGSEIQWRHFDASHEMFADCCITSFKAFPVRSDLEIYLVRALSNREATNILRFPKRNLQPMPEPPIVSR